MAKTEIDAADLIRDASDALIAIDANKRVLSLNPSGTALVGTSEAEAVGRPCAELWIAPLDKLDFTIAYNFQNERSDTLFVIPVFDG